MLFAATGARALSLPTLSLPLPTFISSNSISPSPNLHLFYLYLSISQLYTLQLPIVLQVLLSQAHRVRALCLLARFLDMGSWAVNHALSVGIFPYVLKLLQARS